MFPDLKLAFAEIWLQSSREKHASRGLEGWIKVFNSSLRLILHMGSVKNSAVPWRGARFVSHFKLVPFKEVYECWDGGVVISFVFLFFGLHFKPKIWPQL